MPAGLSPWIVLTFYTDHKSSSRDSRGLPLIPVTLAPIDTGDFMGGQARIRHFSHIANLLQ